MLSSTALTSTAHTSTVLTLVVTSAIHALWSERQRPSVRALVAEAEQHCDATREVAGAHR